MIETRLLYYFLTVARECNITNAARMLHITQPTLSRQMALLEEKVGAKLFIRDSRPLSLTDEGLLLCRRAEEFSGKYPRVKFDVYTANADQVKHRMDNGLTDIGLLLEPVDMERYEYIRLPVKERCAAVMPSGVPLARHEYITAKELADIPVIMPSRQKVHDEVASWFGDYYEKLNIIGATNFSTNSALMVQAGMGYALIIEGGFPFLDDSRICMRPLYPELTATSVLAWKREQPFVAAVSYFLEFAKCFLGMKTL